MLTKQPTGQQAAGCCQLERQGKGDGDGDGDAERTKVRSQTLFEISIIIVL